jgi:hypothetical protein
MWTLGVSKDAEFYLYFKNITYPRDKMHLTKVVPKNMVNCDFFQNFTKTGSVLE